MGARPTTEAFNVAHFRGTDGQKGQGRADRARLTGDCTNREVGGYGIGGPIHEATILLRRRAFGTEDTLSTEGYKC